MKSPEHQKDHADYREITIETLSCAPNQSGPRSAHKENCSRDNRLRRSLHHLDISKIWFWREPFRDHHRTSGLDFYDVSSHSIHRVLLGHGRTIRCHLREIHAKDSRCRNRWRTMFLRCGFQAKHNPLHRLVAGSLLIGRLVDSSLIQETETR